MTRPCTRHISHNRKIILALFLSFDIADKVLSISLMIPYPLVTVSVQTYNGQRKKFEVNPCNVLDTFPLKCTCRKVKILMKRGKGDKCAHLAANSTSTLPLVNTEQTSPG